MPSRSCLFGVRAVPAVLVFAAALAAQVAVAGPAAAAVLESSVLRLTVDSEPYGFQVVEKSTGQVLLTQAGTRLTVAGAPVVVAGTGPFVESEGRLQAPVTLPGSPAPVGATISFQFTAPEVLRVTIAGGDAATQVTQQFHDQLENYYGVWEYPHGGSLDNRGVDEEYLGFGSSSRPGSLYTSGRAPFYVTSRKYGVYVPTDARGRFSFAIGGVTAFTFDERELSYSIIYGPSYADVMARYTTLAGPPVMPPLWALGSIWWADDFHRDLRNATNAQENVIDLATQLQANRIPASGLLVDRPFGTGALNGWGNFDFAPSFPDPPAMVRALQDRGLNLVLWIANRAWNNLRTEGDALMYLFPGSVNLGPATDMRIPAAYDWWKAKLDPFVALGAKGYKIDRGEQGEHPAAVQNLNVTLFTRMARETLTARHGDDVFMMTRNVHDRGRQYTAVWNGDSEPNFLGLRYSVAAGIRSGVIVMPTWGSDTGGYLRSATSPTEEVFARWFGFSAFSPMMEVLVGDRHTPWYDYSPALVDIARKHATTHHDLIPYTRSFLYAATRTGAAVMRPLIFAYPDDGRLANLTDQFLYGSELLVAPVLTAGAAGRSVYLPAGRWLDYNDRRTVHTGGTSVIAAAPLDTIPVFVREGAIVPRGDLLKGNNNWTADWSPSLRIELFPSSRQPGQFEYYTGASVEVIRAGLVKGDLSVKFGDLGVPGKLDIYLSAVGQVFRNEVQLVAGEGYSYDPAAQRLTVAFDGPTHLQVKAARGLFGGDDPPPPPPPPQPPGDGCLARFFGGGPGLSALMFPLLLLPPALRRRRRR
jgi:alpha-glucosidase (family GH31 glycosyl hydrolase)